MLEKLLLLSTSLFTMINPLAVVPLYLNFVSGFDPAAKRKVVLTACLTAFIALTVFALAGQVIFDFFGISTHGLRVVGGVLFFLMGYEMLRGRTVPKKLPDENDEDYGRDIAVTPLGIPMICGPGAITMVILLMQSAATTTDQALVIAAILIVCAVSAVVLFGGGKIMALLGSSGSSVLMRLMGLIVMLIAVEFFFTGLKHYVGYLAAAI